MTENKEETDYLKKKKRNSKYTNKLYILLALNLGCCKKKKKGGGGL